ncbi:hypothetical protein BURMUCGD1_6316 [Burkholderia multivorans CGD1]|nr:hypothetical protein BURMUCGD1_6316 [Burkholderia multivorans CGD1]
MAPLFHSRDAIETGRTYPNGPSSGKSQLLAHVGITHSF